MKYRVRYHVWYVEASTPAEAKKKVMQILEDNPKNFIGIEPIEDYSKPWWRILTGL